MEIGKIAQLLERESGLIKLVGVKEFLFFHADDLDDLRYSELHEGDRVQFSITESRKGPYATQVRRPA